MGMKQGILGANGIQIHLMYIVNAYISVTSSNVMIGRLTMENVRNKQQLATCKEHCLCHFRPVKC